MKIKTQARKNEFLEAYERCGCNISVAAKSIGITRQTVWRWFEDQEFKAKFDEAEEGIKDFVESQMLKKIRGGDTTMIIFYAKTKMKDRGYLEHQKIEHTGKTTQSISLEEIKKVYQESLT